MRKNKWKVVNVLLILIAVAILFSCFYQSKNNELRNSGEKIVTEYLNEIGIYNSELLHLGTYEQVKINESVYSVSWEEIQAYIDTVLFPYITYSEMMEGTVQNGDFVKVDFAAVVDDVVVNRERNVEIQVGGGKFESEFENALIGADVGREYEISFTVEGNGVREQWKGKTECVTFCVNSIVEYYYPELTDEFVRDHFQMDSVNEYTKHISDILYARKVGNIDTDRFNLILEEIADDSVYEIDIDEIAMYSLQIVEQYKADARSYGVSLDTYIRDILQMTETDFFEMCYEEGLLEVKKLLVIRAICHKDGIEIEGCLPEGEDMDNEQDKYDINYLYYLVETKVMELLVAE